MNALIEFRYFLVECIAFIFNELEIWEFIRFMSEFECPNE